MTKKMAKIPLVIFNKQLGDVLLLEPALAKLAAYTKGPVALSTRKAFAPLLSLMENVIPADEGFPATASSIICFDPKFKAWLHSFWTRAPIKSLIVTRPKHLRWWHKLVFREACKAINEDAFYRAQYFFEVMPGSAPMPFRPPRLLAPPVEWQLAGLPESYVVLHPTSAWKEKSWPVEYWAKALRELHEKGVGPFIVTGGNSAWETEYAQTLESLASLPLINLCGKTDLKGYLSLISKASMVLCIDGSATHLASAFERPSVTLFGPTHPLHWHYPSPHSTLVDAHHFASERKPTISCIPVDIVIEASINCWRNGKS